MANKMKVRARFTGTNQSRGFITGNQYTLDFFINDDNRVTVVCGLRVCEYDTLRGFLINFDVL